MTCLTDAQIQSVVDGEGNESLAAHVSACAGCGARVAGRRVDMAALESQASAATMTPGADARIRAAIADAGDAVRIPRGATTLRAAPTRRWFPRGLAPALATAAAVALVVYALMPHVGAPTTMSASEILGRSLQTMAASNGVELLEYDLVVDAAIGRGVHRIEQLVDREHPAHFRVANYLPDGTLQSAISQSPASGRRSHLVRAEGRTFVFTFSGQAGDFLPIPELAQAQLEAVIGMMQATADQKLTIVDGAEGREYVIQVPPVAPTTTSAMLDLHDARTVIDARDFRVRQFQASGTLLKQPWSVSFRLIRSTIRDRAAVADSEFDLPAGPEDIVIEGQATPDAIGDLAGASLRELARAYRR